MTNQRMKNNSLVEVFRTGNWCCRSVGKQVAGLAEFAALDELMTLSELLTMWEEISAAHGDSPLHGAVTAYFTIEAPK